MSTAIIVIILVIICIFAVKSYTKKLSHGCCGGGDSEKRIRVRDKNPDHYPHCFKIGIEGMTCNHCKLKVENALNSETGVWALADLKDESATVHMKNPLSEDALRRIISHSGYMPTYIITEK